MKAVLLGGTFDPPHVGHLHLGDELRRILGTVRVMFIPSHIPAHKTREGGASARDRLRMLAAAVRETPFRYTACEIARGGVSYSIDTVRELRASGFLKEKPFLVIGDDLIGGFPGWKEAQKLAEETDLVVARRSVKPEGCLPFPHVLIDNLVLNISSTDIRERIREGRAFRFLTGDAVYRYIRRRRLYGYR